MSKILVTPRSFGKTYPEAFAELEAAGHIVVRNTGGSIFTKEQMLEQVRDVEGIIVGVDPLDSDVIAAAPALKAIAKYGTGTDNIDLACARERGIAVSTTAGANAMAVADYTFALILACCRRVVSIDKQCHTRDWRKVVTQDVHGKTLGIIGLGAIGKAVARRASGFDMRVLAYRRKWDEDYAKANNIEFASPAEIFRTADIITLHLPLNDATRNIVDAEAIASMKDGAVLVNTARGGLIDEAALVTALRSGKLYAAGLDAFSEEPPSCSELYELDNLIMGSHCAASSIGASSEMTKMAARNIIRDLQGA